jgi:hypothetical protein
MVIAIVQNIETNAYEWIHSQLYTGKNHETLLAI